MHLLLASTSPPQLRAAVCEALLSLCLRDGGVAAEKIVTANACPTLVAMLLSSPAPPPTPTTPTTPDAYLSLPAHASPATAAASANATTPTGGGCSAGLPGVPCSAGLPGTPCGDVNCADVARASAATAAAAAAGGAGVADCAGSETSALRLVVSLCHLRPALTALIKAGLIGALKHLSSGRACIPPVPPPSPSATSPTARMVEGSAAMNGGVVPPTPLLLPPTAQAASELRSRARLQQAALGLILNLSALTPLHAVLIKQGEGQWGDMGGMHDVCGFRV